MPLPLVPIALGAAVLYALSQSGKKPVFTPVKASSGRKWLTRTIAVVGTDPITKVSTIEVWAPAGAYGPHLDTLVATYRQTGSDMNSRVALSTGPSAVPQMITDAGKDFGIKKPS